MLSPLPRHSGWAHYFADSPSRISLPRYGSRVGLCIVLFEACSAFTRVTACTLAPSPIRDALSEGSSLSAGQLGQTGRSLQFQRKAAAFVRWHEPDDARVSRPESVRGSG